MRSASSRDLPSGARLRLTAAGRSPPGPPSIPSESDSGTHETPEPADREQRKRRSSQVATQLSACTPLLSPEISIRLGGQPTCPAEASWRSRHPPAPSRIPTPKSVTRHRNGRVEEAVAHCIGREHATGSWPGARRSDPEDPTPTQKIRPRLTQKIRPRLTRSSSSERGSRSGSCAFWILCGTWRGGAQTPDPSPFEAPFPSLASYHGRSPSAMARALVPIRQGRRDRLPKAQPARAARARR